jgi:hypothetical protein
MSAFAFETPEATVPIPASATSFTDTLALGLICSAKYLLHIFISTKKK